jgi:hypothetical protein
MRQPKRLRRKAQISFHRGMRLEPVHPRLHPKLASLAKSTTHVAADHELTAKSIFAKRDIFSANLPSLQSCPDVSRGRFQARTDIACPRSRAKILFSGDFRGVEEYLSAWPLNHGFHGWATSRRDKKRRGAHAPRLVGFQLSYTSSRIAASSITCCGRPVGSLMVVTDGLMPRL